jgi:ABC-type antimicrobial peptide transport system permease subunit
VKTAIEPASVASLIRTVVRDIDPNLPLAALSTMDRVVAQSIAQRRFMTALVLLFAAAALVLAVIGVYGVVSQGVVRRTPEIGVRLALGARRATVVHMILGEVWALVAVGLLLGVSIALALGSLLRSMLFGVTPHDAATILASCTAIAMAATFAAYAPARRASRVDPMAALRAE